jgi:hypothetical protein
MFAYCECCELSGRGLCDGLITRSEESYRLCRVIVCDLGTSRMRRLELVKGCKCGIEKKEIGKQFKLMKVLVLHFYVLYYLL